MADNELPATEHDDRGAGPATREDAVVSSSQATPREKGQDPAVSDTPATGHTSGGGAGVKRPGDRIFEALSTISAALITVIIAAVGLFLVLQAIKPLRLNKENFFTYTGPWQTSNLENMQFGIPNLFFVTMMVSIIALIIAMPIALGIAIFLSNYAPKQLVRPLATLVDMLAAVPSIVYGLWGAQVLGPALSGFYEWIHGTFLGNTFLFTADGNSPAFATSRNILTGGIVLAIMILPVIAATAREVFVQTPPGQIESALALGATRWEVIRMTVLPFGLSGYIAGSMLGLGRALGETMALYMVVSPSGAFRGSLFDGGTTFATAIANASAEFNNEVSAGAYIAAGLVLFLLTFIVNSIARAIVNK
ncbi:phosphate ABC transporter permease subunit PstC [Corynebacterium sp. CCUG 71335]|uniref:phosphate ABC transporter permease subunit PstC n=1 Tax=unclassified Corynebacterium TaxID=2624378 RepID=UPI00210954E5|nr:MULTISPECIES: phosphate ABC transporter permease subunit PstC [unclassified Corynebacterium]MCQ4619451.1 phosphate ABC transporter permease subunit PstC [Corynebacterium pseudogenitalium]MCQ4621629.1 phosphate ABC transporter permease subunit PstC [Corynebacterium sp. CCUG 71335]MCQ4623532.1 phosphate ABC transporter permease subunit PstC [Corynebacterium sp. CCUG 70398]MCQ4625427.1 phosphate ABC transporter permease subunit PstC [Corynebacterium sp. CCUG 69979]MCQ4627476.1 phosphate ABC tr